MDEKLQQTWREREEYVEMIKAAELRDGPSGLLSACLSSKRTQAIASCYGAYTSVGKLGTYDRVIEELEKI